MFFCRIYINGIICTEEKNMKKRYRYKNVRMMRYRPDFQINRKKWEFHPYDDDPNPSIPHGHSLDSKHKLDPYTGLIYEGERVIGKVKKKELERLWKDKRFLKTVVIAKRFHEAEDKTEFKRTIGRLQYRTRYVFFSEVEMYEVSEQE
jgi:hypothetical protein